jgi:dipeptidyl aminopeptidase/acylaminoacyl peptidase
LCFDVPGITNCIDGRFREYWEQNGGLEVFGYPISPAVNEQTMEGAFLTQYFERNRFELHPQQQPPYDVLLGRLGADRLRATGTDLQLLPTDEQAQPDCVWFPQTKYNVCNQGDGAGFKQYWETHGLLDPRIDPYARSLALFGLPVTPAQISTNAQGDRVLAQWFERARFEWHPDKPEPFRVLLGLLGQETRTPTQPNLAGRIVYVSREMNNNDLYVLDVGSGTRTRLTNTPEDEIEPTWSPDGTLIAFTVDDTMRNDIYVMRADGSRRTRLTTGTMEGTNPAWSPDGQRIAFVSWNDEENTALFVMKADGSNLARLTEPTGTVEHDDPAWSPDGQRLAFTAWGAGDAGTSDIRIVNADGTNDRRIAWGGGFDWDPAWSPDGRFIAFASDTGGSMALRVASTEGNDVTQLTYTTFDIGDPTWSPDGRSILFEDATYIDDENSDGYVVSAIYAMPFEPAGAPAPQTRLFEHLQESEVSWTAPSTPR